MTLSLRLEPAETQRLNDRRSLLRPASALERTIASNGQPFFFFFFFYFFRTFSSELVFPLVDDASEKTFPFVPEVV